MVLQILGADTCVLEQEWEVLSVHNTRRANVVVFDHEAAVKRNLPIISAITAVDLPDETSMILITNYRRNQFTQEILIDAR
jgi:hypothetical protein